jgi:alpha-D-ribose 1-methylphosphonate 5-triphosphate synthase subunit PhnH
LIATNIAQFQRSIREQSHFRALLNAMARPGTICELTDTEIDHPAALDAAAVAVALALLDADVTYSCSHLGEDADRFIARRTSAKSVPAVDANFIFVDAASPTAIARIENADSGSALEPEASATIIAAVHDLSQTAHAGTKAIRLTGPGIESESVVYVSGPVEAFVNAVAAKNATFPFGVDVLMTCAPAGRPARVVAIPRTARFV